MKDAASKRWLGVADVGFTGAMVLAGGVLVDDGFVVEDVGVDVVFGAFVVDELLASVVFVVDGASEVLLEFVESVGVGALVEDPLVLGLSVVTVLFPESRSWATTTKKEPRRQPGKKQKDCIKVEQQRLFTLYNNSEAHVDSAVKFRTATEDNSPQICTNLIWNTRRLMMAMAQF